MQILIVIFFLIIPMFLYEFLQNTLGAYLNNQRVQRAYEYQKRVEEKLADKRKEEDPMKELNQTTLEYVTEAKNYFKEDLEKKFNQELGRLVKDVLYVRSEATPKAIALNALKNVVDKEIQTLYVPTGLEAGSLNTIHGFSNTRLKITPNILEIRPNKMSYLVECDACETVYHFWENCCPNCHSLCYTKLEREQDDEEI